MNEKGTAEGLSLHRVSLRSDSRFKAEIASVRFRHRDRGIQRNYERGREEPQTNWKQRQAIARHYSSFETYYSKFAR